MMDRDGRKAAMLQVLNRPRLWFGIGLAVCATTSAEDWPQLQHDPQHSGRSAVSVVPGYEAKWVWVDEAHVTHHFVSMKGASIDYPNPRTVIVAGDVQPIVAEDRLYFGACNGAFYALNGADGSTAWKRELGGPILHTAAYAQGTV